MNIKLVSVNKKFKCPNCNGKKLQRVYISGVSFLVCSCGYKQVLQNYPNNVLNAAQIETR
jgi:transcription elongation factor Elf1